MKLSVLPRDRRGLFARLGEFEVLRRYRQNYRLGEAVGLLEVRRHAELEAELTDQLLTTSPDDRTAVFSQAYSRLYAELPWLVETGTQSGGEMWAKLLHPGASVYEVGSGAGYLINYLAGQGFQCVGTDIAADRKTAAVRSRSPHLTWEVTDGVHLSRYAQEQSFDYVISNQVVEHLHPEDIVTHFSEARKLLKAGGKYIVSTPYAPCGPADLSGVFGWDKPIFMHLHEFSYGDFAFLTAKCKFRSISGAFFIPKTAMALWSGLHVNYARLIERLAGTEPFYGGQPNLIKRRRWLNLNRTILVSMQK